MSAPVKFFFAIIIFIFLAIYVVFGPFFLVKAIPDTAFYLTERNNTIQVKATVVDIDESSSSDGGTEYDVYVSYEYNNKTYNGIYWKTVGLEKDYSVNDAVHVEIFKSRPDDIVDAGIANYIGWVFPLLVTIIGPLALIKTFSPNFTLIKKRKV